MTPTLRPPLGHQPPRPPDPAPGRRHTPVPRWPAGRGRRWAQGARPLQGGGCGADGPSRRAGRGPHSGEVGPGGHGRCRPAPSIRGAPEACSGLPAHTPSAPWHGRSVPSGPVCGAAPRTAQRARPGPELGALCECTGPGAGREQGRGPREGRAGGRGPGDRQRFRGKRTEQCAARHGGAGPDLLGICCAEPPPAPSADGALPARLRAAQNCAPFPEKCFPGCFLCSPAGCPPPARSPPPPEWPGLEAAGSLATHRPCPSRGGGSLVGPPPAATHVRPAAPRGRAAPLVGGGVCGRRVPGCPRDWAR